MADFVLALPFVLKHEGGECDVVGDGGGHTNMGVTQKTLDAWNAKHPDANFPANVHDLTRDHVAQIYREGYWRFDSLVDQRCATKILDTDVNDGLPSGIRIAQRAAIRLGASVTVDGAFGPATAAALNGLDADALLGALVDLSVEHYEAVLAACPGDEKFRGGWMARARELPDA